MATDITLARRLKCLRAFLPFQENNLVYYFKNTIDKRQLPQSKSFYGSLGALKVNVPLYFCLSGWKSLRIQCLLPVSL